MPFGLGFGELLLVTMIGIVPAIALWRIVAKAGYPGPLALFVFVPLLNVVLLVAFAFSEWPLEREAGAARQPR
jgi:hypothetical protein